jgi:hypothetical protein
MHLVSRRTTRRRNATGFQKILEEWLTEGMLFAIKMTFHRIASWHAVYVLILPRYHQIRAAPITMHLVSRRTTRRRNATGFQKILEEWLTEGILFAIKMTFHRIASWHAVCVVILIQMILQLRRQDRVILARTVLHSNLNWITRRFKAAIG